MRLSQTLNFMLFIFFSRWHTTKQNISQVTTHSSVIHEYYVRECNNPVHLTVDTTLTNTTRMAIKAYVCVPLGVPNGKQGSMFTPVKVQVCQNICLIGEMKFATNCIIEYLKTFVYRDLYVDITFNIIKPFHVDYMLRARSGRTTVVFKDTIAISHTSVWNEIYRRDRTHDGSCASLRGLLQAFFNVGTSIGIC